MKEIKKKIDELEKLLSKYKATGKEQRAFNLIKSYISLAQNAASFKSRVKTNPNPSEQAAKLNEAYKDATKQPAPKKQEQKKRGRPKKTNVLASTTDNKTLTEKLKND